ncbi:hypothetical protein [Lonepinella sp. BR2271]|uniref:hypothetical protein n=1 Tax=Lonepinella sp. BR2271 TaxID=3434550 RepID=UPI003F6DD42C
MNVTFAPSFSQKLRDFIRTDREKVFDFAKHVEQHGFTGLQGRNKSSDQVPSTDPNRKAKIRYAKQHNLWHYHIGIPYYRQSSQGDWVSEFVVHYIKQDNQITLIDIMPHPPFKLPHIEQYLH